MNERKALRRRKNKKIKKKKEKYHLISFATFPKLIIYIGLILFIFFNRNHSIKENLKMIDKDNNIIENCPKNNKIIEYDLNKTNNLKYTIKKDLNDEYNDMQEFLLMSYNHTLYNPNEIFYMSKNPKISIVISVYNSEGFLKTALTSIQNQDFKDIEIIMIDDCSKDNSISLIKDLMKNDQRIILLQNKENRGCLYTKAQGVLHAKAKYVMTLDSDDIYSQRDTFTTLFFEAEKNNLDILGFASIVSGINIKRGDYIHRYMETPVVFQPEIINFMYKNKNGYVKRVGDVIWNYFFKTELFQKSIKQIDDKFFNIKMVYHDDFLFFFILTRNAKSLRQIKRVFYIMLSTPRKNNTIFQIHDDIKEKYKDNLCSSYLNYVEFILNKTNNTIEDKRIASYELNANFLDHECRNNEVVQKEGINICKLFLQNEYIENDIKDKIKLFLVEKNQNV